jgi:hypothetical protein
MAPPLPANTLVSMKFVYSYIKGYEFDYDKASEAYPQSNPYQLLTNVVRILDRDEYITVGSGHRVDDGPDKRRVIFVVDAGNDITELKQKPFDDTDRPGLRYFATQVLTGPDVFVSDE